MAWFYEIRDPKDIVISKGEGFKTQQDALAAGEAEVERLRRTGNIMGGGFGTVTTGQDSTAPWK